MSDLTVGVFGRLDITSPMDVEKRLAYTKSILIRAALKYIERGYGSVQAVGEGTCGR